MDTQLTLPLDTNGGSDVLLRLAWARSGLRVPFHVALQVRSLAICLRCLADAIRRNCHE